MLNFMHLNYRPILYLFANPSLSTEKDILLELHLSKLRIKLLLI